MRTFTVIFWTAIHLLIVTTLFAGLASNKDVLKGIEQSLVIGITK